MNLGHRARGVGLTYIRIGVAGHRRAVPKRLRVLVDTGASLSMFPARTLKGLGVVPTSEVLVRLADGRRVPRGVGEAYVRYGKYGTHTWVLFGGPRDASVLGALTLEELGLQVDARSQRLREIKEVLLVAAETGDRSLAA